MEICLDAEGAVWIMLHSGSRNVGKTIGESAMDMAKKVAEQVDRRLPHRDLAWLDEGTPEFEAYVEGLGWAQEYASLNRDLMLHLVHKALAKSLGREVKLRRRSRRTATTTTRASRSISARTCG